MCTVVLIIGLFPSASIAQTAPGQVSTWAPVVLDGQVLFKVHDLSNLSAEQRAASINASIQKEAESSEQTSVVVVTESGYVVLQGYPSEHNLLTVTERDVTTATTPYGQAIIWQGILQDEIRQAQLERSPEYLRRATIYSAVVLAIAAMIHGLLWLIGRWGSKRIRQWLDATHTPLHSWKDSLRIVWKLAFLGLELGLWAAVLLYVTDLFPETRMARYRLWGFLNARIITLGTSNYSALNLLLLLGLTAGLWFGISTLTRLFRFYVLQPAGVNSRIQDVVAVLFQYALTFLGLIILLQIWGVDVSSLAILASVLGVGIGFGIQNITNNFISGFIITLERPIEVGDFVNLGELVGIVERIGARSTEIRTLDQVTIIVPNSRFLESEVINWSHGDPVCRMHLPVGVAYGSDVDKVKMALLEAARRHPEVLLRPRPEVWFQGFGDSALNFDLLVWTGDPKRQFKVKSDVYYEIEASLRRHGLEIPFPQRDLHVRSPELSALVDALATQFPSPSDLPPLPTLQLKAAAEQTKPEAEQPRSPDELQSLIDAWRSEGGVSIGDRQYQCNLYPQCFIGSEAVGWLVEHWNCTREEALQWGQALLNADEIRVVTGDSKFQDGYYFYRFREDEEAIAQSWNLNGGSNVASTDGDV